MSTTPKDKEKNRILTPPFRMSFPAVFKPKAPFAGQEPCYNIQMLFPKNADLTALKNKIKEVAKETWPQGIPKTFRQPLRDGAEKQLDSYKDMIFANAKSKMKPGVVDKDLNEIVDPAEVYAGRWARAKISVFSYNKAGNMGVAFGLENLQILKHDEAFSGRKNAKDDFDKIEELEGDESFTDSSSDDAALGMDF